METWLSDGTSLEEDKQDLLLGAGISLLCRNSKPDHRGVSYEGVAIIYKDLCSIRQLNLDNADDFEILAAVSSIWGYSKKLATLACDIPPNYSVARGNSCLKYIEELVIELKRRLKDPYIIETGDINQWDLDKALQALTWPNPLLGQLEGTEQSTVRSQICQK